MIINRIDNFGAKFSRSKTGAKAKNGPKLEDINLPHSKDVTTANVSETMGGNAKHLGTGMRSQVKNKEAREKHL